MRIFLMSNKRKLYGNEWKNALAKGDFWHLAGGMAPLAPKSASDRDNVPWFVYRARRYTSALRYLLFY